VGDVTDIDVKNIGALTLGALRSSDVGGDCTAALPISSFKDEVAV